MRSYLRSLWVSVVCAVVLSGAPGVAVADDVSPSPASSVTTTDPRAMITPTLPTSEISSRDGLAISVSPTSGFPKTVVTVRGTGWTHQVYADGVDVEISQNYGNGQLTRLTSAKSGPPDANGAFSLRMTIPVTAKPGLLSISPITGGSEISDALFTVTGGGTPSGQQDSQPSVKLTPSDGPPKTVVTATGHGFIPNQSVTVTQSGGPGVTGGGGTVQADQAGSINMSFRIADQTPSGVIMVTFKQSASSATAQFRATSPTLPNPFKYFVPGEQLDMTRGGPWWDPCHHYIHFTYPSWMDGHILSTSVQALDPTTAPGPWGSPSSGQVNYGYHNISQAECARDTVHKASDFWLWITVSR